MDLTKSRENLMQKIEEILQQDSDVQAIFYGGSIGSGNPDEYSDIDIRVVISKVKNKREKLENLVQHLDSLLFFEEAGNNYAVIHFGSFIKMDLFIYFLDELTPNPWLTDIKVIKDTNSNDIETLKKNSQVINVEPSANQLDVIINKFLAYSSESYRRLQRNELHYFQHCILGMKNCLASLWLLENGYKVNSIGDWSKYEGSRSKLSKDQLDWLQRYLYVDNKLYSKFIEQSFLELSKSIEIIKNKYNLSVDKSKIKKIKESIDLLMN